MPVLRAVAAALAAGVACLAHALVLAQAGASPPLETSHGGIVRGPTDAKRIALLFTGHEFAEGGETILAELAKRSAKASFFLTGDFLRRKEFGSMVRQIVASGHYLAPHSDRHLLYCGWESNRPTLVTRDAFTRDLEDNLREVARFGVQRADVRDWVPAYEWYNAEIASWSGQLGLRVITFTPGTRANADYTGEADRNFVPSRVIFDSILARERSDPHGLNGFLLLMHVGAGPGRRDKMHALLGELLDRLAERGYEFARVDRLLGT